MSTNKRFYQSFVTVLLITLLTISLGGATKVLSKLSSRAITQCIPWPNGLTAFYKFDESSGNIAADSVNRNNGTLMNGPLHVSGKVSYGLMFDGSNDYVVVRSNPQVNFGYGDFSIEAWIKTSSSYGNIVSKRLYHDSPGYLFMVYDGKLLLQMTDDIKGWYNNIDWNTPTVSDGYYHHVAVTVVRNNSEGGKMYVDGVLVYTFNPIRRSGNLDTTADLWIGQEGGGGEFFNGIIDEVSIYKRAITSAEVQQIFQAGSYGKCSTPPVAKNLTLISPNGGEKLGIGYSYAITWSSSGLTGGNVKLEYSINNGANWIAISNSAPNTGSFTWLIPDSISTQGKIRITSLEYPTITDTSDNPFTINRVVQIPERSALIQLYNSTNGDSWTNKAGWKTPPLYTDGFAMPGTEGTWKGITMSNNSVIEIDLSENNLVGTIPSSLENLVNLQVLMLNTNKLSGNIPSSLGNLRQLLYLYLYQNELTGSIPPSLGNLSNLNILNLGTNQLSGSIPPELGNLSVSYLRAIHISYNRLSGSIPSEIGKLTGLQTLAMTNNQLSGNIPLTLGNLRNLNNLYLTNNLLSGGIPSSLGNLTMLIRLRLDGNQLTGRIPSELGNLYSLQYLTLNNNQLSGEIPSSLKNLTSISAANDLDIRYNCGFTATDPALRTYLNAKNPGWETQQNQCGSLTLISPNGGEKLGIGYSYAITWNSSGLTGNVKIEYSIDNGANWIAISNSAPNTGSFTWLIPDSISTQGKIRITSLEYPTITDTSDNPFTIYKIEQYPKRSALIKLYNSTNGDSWMNKTGWKTPPLYADGFAMPGTENSWYGISFAANNVYQINLQNNNLTGILPDIFTDLFGLHFLYLNNNNLTGNIPASIGTVTTLEDIKLNNNQLTGSIPSSFNALSMLQYLDLSSNQLSGESLPDLSSLSNFQGLNLSRNNFTFRIPSWIGLLTKLTSINLSNNKLIGGIPSAMGDLSNLQYLYLNYNMLEGKLPLELMKLTKLISADIGNNALYTDNPELIAFLNSKNPNWQLTQTIAPKNVRVAGVTSSRVTLNWDLIPFLDKAGGYDVYISTSPGGNYTKFNSTSNKSTSIMIVDGLRPATTYYFVVKTRTVYDPARIVESGFSNEVSATTALQSLRDMKRVGKDL